MSELTAVSKSCPDTVVQGFQWAVHYMGSPGPIFHGLGWAGTFSTWAGPGLDRIFPGLSRLYGPVCSSKNKKCG